MSTAVQRDWNQRHDAQYRKHLGHVYLHSNAGGESRFYGNFYSIIVLGFLDRERSQYLDDHRPHGRVGKVPPDTNAPAESECDILDVIRSECAVVVEEALGDKFVRIWVLGFIVAHRPSKVRTERGRSVSVGLQRGIQQADQRLDTTIAPANTY